MSESPLVSALRKLKKDYQEVQYGEDAKLAKLELRLLRTLGKLPESEEQFYKTRYGGIKFSPSVITSGMPDSVWREHLEDGKQRVVDLIDILIEELQEEEPPAISQKDPQPIGGNKVFIVHGKDEQNLRYVVASFLADGGYDPIILHEQTNQGQTLIEKLLHYAEQGVFAVILLAGEDQGHRRGSLNVVHPRARQNVVFEFGLFIGLLGRERVAALIPEEDEKKIEKPSDIDGLMYTTLDKAGGWKEKLRKELESLRKAV